MKKEDILFFEPHTAAQSQKNAWTRLASTYSCMMITLTAEKLTIKPHWYASPLVRLLGLDLIHEIPVTDIENLTESGMSAGYGKVDLKFRAGDGNERTILLFLKNHARFIEAVKATVAGRQGAEYRGKE